MFEPLSEKEIEHVKNNPKLYEVWTNCDGITIVKRKPPTKYYYHLVKKISDNVYTEEIIVEDDSEISYNK
jgi:hypothetical protein